MFKDPTPVRIAEQAVPEGAANHLWSLIEERKKEGVKDADYVFLGYTGRGGQTKSDKPISDTGVYLTGKYKSFQEASIQMVEWCDKRRFSVDENVGVGLEYEE